MSGLNPNSPNINIDNSNIRGQGVSKKPSLEPIPQELRFTTMSNNNIYVNVKSPIFKTKFSYGSTIANQQQNDFSQLNSPFVFRESLNKPAYSQFKSFQQKRTEQSRAQQNIYKAKSDIKTKQTKQEKNTILLNSTKQTNNLKQQNKAILEREQQSSSLCENLGCQII